MNVGIKNECTDMCTDVVQKDPHKHAQGEVWADVVVRSSSKVYVVMAYVVMAYAVMVRCGCALRRESLDERLGV